MARPPTISKPSYPNRDPGDSDPDMTYLSLTTRVAVFAMAVTMTDKEKGYWEFILLLV